MSQIFDALQRAEAERSGKASETPLRATEILERAEKLAANEWEKADSSVEVRETPAVQGVSPALRAVLGTAAERQLAEPQRAGLLEAVQTIEPNFTDDSRMVCVTDKNSPSAEAFRLLGLRIHDMRQGRILKKILVTSTIPQEGKSTVAANLACTLSQSVKERVLLLEGDVRRPAQSRVFGLTAHPGICDWLQGDKELAECLWSVPSAGIWIMPAGATSRNPLDLLKSVHIGALMQQLESLFDTIIIDSPPVLPLADTSVWTRLVDGVLLVVRQGVTEKRQLTRGIEAIEKDKLIGALLNCSEHAAHSYYYY